MQDHLGRYWHIGKETKDGTIVKKLICFTFGREPRPGKPGSQRKIISSEDLPPVVGTHHSRKRSNGTGCGGTLYAFGTKSGTKSGICEKCGAEVMR